MATVERVPSRLLSAGPTARADENQDRRAGLLIDGKLSEVRHVSLDAVRVVVGVSILQ